MTTAATPPMFERLNHTWWVRLPAAAKRRSRALTGILGDGLYVSAIPQLSALMPPALLLLGLLIGWTHPTFRDEAVYSASLFIITLMFAISNFSAAWGAWLWTGYIVGDLLFYPHGAFRAFGIVAHLFLVRLPLLIPYALLALLLIFTPIIARSLLGQTAARLRRAGSITLAMRAGLQALVQGALVFAWTQSVPSLIRPVWTWNGSVPTVGAIQPLQQSGWLLAIIAGLLGAVRIVVEHRLSRQPDVIRRRIALRDALAQVPATAERPLPTPAYVGMKAASTTFMLSGLLETWFDALLFSVVITAAFLGREYLAARLALWARVVSRIPLLLRLILGMVINSFLAQQIVTAFWDSSSFRPITISVTISMIIFFLLIPDARARAVSTRGRGNQASS